ncbi:ATP-binding protein [Draconibacterium sp. IB214405]|uniref:sensor histidine kinase n=1 Tax=Draconibacterium sp. IB214405 TaxID=3097352 RepID=UPI002A103BCF|nr:ATP-binding protein [Draconibacterium sp. IB214405]MDX8340367.1 ATP-binding protein [Draconibacterium sp. IB214405]
MLEEQTLTSYAPAMRYTNGQLESQFKTILENKQLVNFVESISQMVLILNRHRQVVYANKSYKDFCANLNHDPIIGKRPGETFNCANAFKSSAGCGTSESCKSCGAVNAILESHKGIRSTQECQILTKDNDALDLEVTANPLILDDEKLTIFSVNDISAQKRRISLERVFIHDLLNSAGAISGLSSILKEIDDPDMIKDIAATIEDASQSLIEEIQIQRELGAAERGELHMQMKEINSSNFLTDLQKTYAKHELNAGKPIHISTESVNCTMTTDPVLLRRILGNMLKNAIETNVPHDMITLMCKKRQNVIELSVHNNSIIPKENKDQIFKRFFSTKGGARGLGTYSMKLFGEKYLKGNVGFTSSEEAGTTFYIQFPVS